jgi:hypothetical protein
VLLLDVLVMTAKQLCHEIMVDVAQARMMLLQTVSCDEVIV